MMFIGTSINKIRHFVIIIIVTIKIRHIVVPSKSTSHRTAHSSHTRHTATHTRHSSTSHDLAHQLLHERPDLRIAHHLLQFGRITHGTHWSTRSRHEFLECRHHLWILHARCNLWIRHQPRHHPFHAASRSAHPRHSSHTSRHASHTSGHSSHTSTHIRHAAHTRRTLLPLFLLSLLPSILLRLPDFLRPLSQFSLLLILLLHLLGIHLLALLGSLLEHHGSLLVKVNRLRGTQIFQGQWILLCFNVALSTDT
mmetsp:Transcript_11925/g.22072  ORF Transcript_11925/g.22072 Transcript_11925/m.22072 type:complete len:253 (+) Transcript_11925:183-941(+)